MSEYASTLEGFQKAMEWSLTGPASEAKDYAEATSTPSFYHVMNGHHENSNTNKLLPIYNDQFLRDGDNLAAHMPGTLKLDGVDFTFESFMFAKVDEKSGKLESMVERSVWGPVGGKSDEHGAN
ncbi:hypothetical protein F5Y17DRAFT_455494 [Xylariaceae sp. FL0594]|nr:hypothetical protein F5Y17DRAFT_455494 [Xylariaceae sp. FL0594]